MKNSAKIMLLQFLLILVSGLVQASERGQEAVCRFELVAIPSLERFMREIDCEYFSAGVLTHITTEEVKKLVSDAKFVNQATFRFGTGFRLRIIASCLVTAKWNSFYFRITDEDATTISFCGPNAGQSEFGETVQWEPFEEVIEDEGIVLESEGGIMLDTILSFRYPKDLDSWRLEFLASTHDSAREPFIILHDSDPVILFPRVEPILEISPGLSTAAPKGFPEGYTCVLELWRDLGSAITLPSALPFFQLSTPSPILANSLWHLMTSNPTNFDVLSGSPKQSTVTRLYVSNELYGFYSIDMFFAENLSQYVSFVSC